MKLQDRVNRRLIFLLVLAAFIFTLRGYFIYIITADRYANDMEMGVITEVKNGALLVKSVVEKRYTGIPTSGSRAGIKAGDRIVAVYNQSGRQKSIEGHFDLGEIWKTIKYGESWSLDVIRDGRQIHLSAPQVPAPQKGFHYWFVRVVVFIMLPVLVLFVGFFLGFAKPQDDNAFRACLFFAGFSFVLGMPFQYFPPFLREAGILVSSVAVCFSAYLFANFFFFFPSRSILDRKFPWLRKLLFWFALLLSPVNISTTYTYFSSYTQFEWLGQKLKWMESFYGILPLASLLTGLLALALHTIKAETKDDRRKMTILLLGALIGLVPLATFVSVYSGNESSPIPPFWVIVALAITLAVFPLSFLYVVLRHRVLGIRLILRRGLQYALVSRGFFVVEGFVIFAVVYLILGTLQILNYSQLGVSTFITAACAFAVAAGLRHVNEKAMNAIDRRFFRQAYNAQQVLTELGRSVRKLVAQPDKLFDLVTDKISDSIFPDKVAVFLLSNGNQPEFRCRGLRVQTGYHDEVWCDPDAYSGYSLTGDSFLGRQLKRFTTEELGCLEVFLNDPKSWAHSLMKINPNDARYREKDLVEKLNTRLIVPLVSTNEILGFLSLGEKLSEEAYSSEDKQLLLTVAEQTAIAIEYANLIRQVAEQEKMKRELQIATEVQSKLFPQKFPEMKSLQYTGYCRAARHVGGDYYDFLDLNSGNLGIALGDVSGKGISSALLMANLQALLRSGAPLRLGQMDMLLADMNRLLCESTTKNKYATFFYSVYSDESKLLTYVNAGHLPPMVFRADSQTVDRLRTGGLVVGMLPDVTYKEDFVQLSSGDVLVIYSDGLSEAMNLSDDEFGEERLMSVVSSNIDLSLPDLRDAILDDVARFVGEADQHDDLTLVLARVT